MYGQIFISYRRNDTRWVVLNLYEKLTRIFSADQIFIDVDSIAYGKDFVVEINKAVRQCDVFIAVIGQHWLNFMDEYTLRSPGKSTDLVRVEIAAALKRKIPLIPILVDGVSIPGIENLPDDLKLLSRKNAIEISHKNYNRDVDRLIEILQKYLKEVAQARQQIKQDTRTKAEEKAKENEVAEKNKRKPAKQVERKKTSSKAEGNMSPKEVERLKKTKQNSTGKQRDLKARQFLQKIAEEKRISRVRDKPKINQPDTFKQARKKNIRKEGDLKAQQFLQKIAEEKRISRAEVQEKQKQVEEAKRRPPSFEDILKKIIDKWRY